MLELIQLWAELAETNVEMQNLRPRVNSTTRRLVVTVAMAVTTSLTLTACISFKEPAPRPWEDVPAATLEDIDKSAFWVADGAEFTEETVGEQDVYDTLDNGRRCNRTFVARSYLLSSPTPFTEVVSGFGDALAAKGWEASGPTGLQFNTTPVDRKHLMTVQPLDADGNTHGSGDPDVIVHGYKLGYVIEIPGSTC